MIQGFIDRLGLGVRNFRRAAARVIEPSKPEPDPKWDIPIRLSLRGAGALRKYLSIDEPGYLFASGATWADPRAYVLYTALDEVKKSAMYLSRHRDLLSGPPVLARDDRISRLLLAQVLEEQGARERRLIELLVTLVLCETTNEPEYYRDLLLLEELDDLLSSNQDLEEFYGARSANIDYSISLRESQIREVETHIELSKTWYRRNAGPLPGRPSLRPGRLLSSVRSRLKLALPRMTARERLLIGFSYAGYGRVSEVIHYSPNPADREIRDGHEQAVVHRLGILNFMILDRCHELLGRPQIPIIEQLRGALQRADPAQIVFQRTVRDIQKGDFVLAYGDLAEVIDVREGGYGYRSYRVRYLAEKPLKQIEEDWFPAYYVSKLYTREGFLERIKGFAGKDRTPDELTEVFGLMSPEDLQIILREALVETWKHGLRDWAKGRRG